MDGKVCNVCGEHKPLDAFNRNKRIKDGYSNRCRECANAYLREWCRNNPEKSRAYSRRDYMKHRDARREYGRRYYAEHREACLAYYKRYRDEGGETYKAYRRQYDRLRNLKKKAAAS